MTHWTAVVPYQPQAIIHLTLAPGADTELPIGMAQQDFLLTSWFNCKNKIVTVKGLKTDGIVNITSFFLVIFLLYTLGLIINSLSYFPSSSLISLLPYPFLLSAIPFMACLPFFDTHSKLLARMHPCGCRVDQSYKLIVGQDALNGHSAPFPAIKPQHCP